MKAVPASSAALLSVEKIGLLTPLVRVPRAPPNTPSAVAMEFGPPVPVMPFTDDSAMDSAASPVSFRCHTPMYELHTSDGVA